MATITTEAALYRLLAWLSPAFPVGGYAYSHGIEYAVEAGLTRDATTLAGWIEGILRHGAGRMDAMLFVAASRAAEAGDDVTLASVAELADALRPTAELALESRAQGAAFLSAVRAAWPHPKLDRLTAALAAAGLAPSYAVTVAAATAIAGISLEAALAAYVQAFAAALVAAGVKLVPLGQTEGQIVVARLEAVIGDCVAGALERPLADIGAAAPMVDWTSVQHETQYTRLYRS